MVQKHEWAKDGIITPCQPHSRPHPFIKQNKHVNNIINRQSVRFVHRKVKKLFFTGSTPCCLPLSCYITVKAPVLFMRM